MRASSDRDVKGVRISFPVKCEYHGDLSELGAHGRNFWIENDQIGHGQVGLAHSMSLSEVASTEVAEREVGGSEGSTFTFPSLPGAPVGIRPTPTYRYGHHGSYQGR